MIKKILLWSLYAGVVGFLIFGAVIRTEAITAGLDPRIEAELAGGGSEDRVVRDGGGYSSAESELHLAEDEANEWLRLSGTVAALDADSLWIDTIQRGSLEITGRAWKFILDGGLAFRAGDQVALEGFDEGGEFEIARIENLTTGFLLQVRDESGRPLWGRGADR